MSVETQKQRNVRSKKKIIICIVLVCASILTMIAITFAVVIPSVKYNNAMEAIRNGEYIKAYNILMELRRELGGYKDCQEQLAKLKDDYYMEKIRYASVGDFVYFGRYEQDGDETNGKELILWDVLAKDGNKVLLFSRYILCEQPYNDTLEDTTWAKSSLRTWLNATFYETAFNSKNKSMIVTTCVEPSYTSVIRNHEEIDIGETTNDKVFLLSEKEVLRYLPFEKDLGKCTEYEHHNAGWGHNCHSTWWLRTTGSYQDMAIMVAPGLLSSYLFSYIDCISTTDVNECYGICPAIWVEFEDE